MRHTVILLLALAGTAHAGVAARGLDAITAPGEPVAIAAKFEGGRSLLWHPDLQDEPVEFEIAGVRASARTDRDGVARVRVRVPRPGVVPFTARLRDRPDAPVARGRLWVLDPARPVAVVDIDETLSHMRSFLVPFRGHRADTYPGAPALLHDLSARHQIVYLTARDDFFDDKTRAFLDRHGFPDAPIIYNDLGVSTAEERDQLRSSNHGAYKTDVIRDLRARGLDVRLGIGNAETDAEAYEATAIDSYIRAEEPRGGASFYFPDYASLRPRLVADGHLPAAPGMVGALSGP